MKEKYINLADRIWHILLISFSLDFLLSGIVLFDLSSHSINSAIVTTLLVLSLVANSENLIPNTLERIKNFQSKIKESNTNKYSLVFYALILIAISTKLLLGLGLLANINIYTLLIPLFIIAVSFKHILQEKRKHDLLIEADYSYSQKNELIQNLTLSLLPAVAARVAAFISMQSVISSNYNLVSISQYCIAFLLFTQSFPKGQNILHSKKAVEYRRRHSYS